MVDKNRVDEWVVGQGLMRRPKCWLAKRAVVGWLETWKQCIAAMFEAGMTEGMRVCVPKEGV